MSRFLEILSEPFDIAAARYLSSIYQSDISEYYATQLRQSLSSKNVAKTTLIMRELFRMNDADTVNHNSPATQSRFASSRFPREMDDFGITILKFDRSFDQSGDGRARDRARTRRRHPRGLFF